MGTSTTTLTYDDENRVTGITYPSSATNSFVYNGLGLRVSKNDSAGAFAYVCDGTGVASAVLKDGAATYTPGLSERRGTTSKFTHKDALGSTRGITNSSQTTTDAMLFDAFGMTVSRTGTTPTPFGFVGGAQYQTDADSGLMLLGHRYYDASIGRFISEDPIQAGDNWYAYCENNPVVAIDPNGLDHNDGSVHNGSPGTQFGLGDVDGDRYKIVPYIPKQFPLPPNAAIPPSVAKPTNPKDPWYPVWPTKDPWGNPAYIFPSAPGTTVGGGGVDIDAGWDPTLGKWIKTPGWLPGGNSGNWDPKGGFHPGWGNGGDDFWNLPKMKGTSPVPIPGKIVLPPPTPKPIRPKAGGPKKKMN